RDVAKTSSRLSVACRRQARHSSKAHIPKMAQMLAPAKPENPRAPSLVPGTPSGEIVPLPAHQLTAYGTLSFFTRRAITFARLYCSPKTGLYSYAWAILAPFAAINSSTF